MSSESWRILLREVPLVDGVQRHRHQRDQGQPPLQPDEQDRDPQREDQVVDQLQEAALEEAEDRADVARDPRHQLAGLLRVEVGHREPHELPVQGGPQRDDDLLADPPHHRGHPPGERRPRQEAGDRGGQRPDDHPRRGGRLGRAARAGTLDQGDEAVDDPPLEQRDGQDQERLREQSHQPQRDPPSVRPQEPGLEPSERGIGLINRRFRPGHVDPRGDIRRGSSPKLLAKPSSGRHGRCRLHLVISNEWARTRIQNPGTPLGRQ